MFIWKEEYCTGITIIDDQHKELFRIANRLYDLLKNDIYVDKYNKIVGIIEELKDYTVFHFKTEEEYLAKVRYNKFFAHKVQHDDFVSKFNDIDLNKIDHGQDEYIEETFSFIYNWIVEHILKNDMAYVDALKGGNVL